MTYEIRVRGAGPSSAAVRQVLARHGVAASEVGESAPLTLLTADGLRPAEVLRQIQDSRGAVCWVISSQPFAADFLIAAVRMGATNFFQLPAEASVLCRALSEQLPPIRTGISRMVGSSNAIRSVRERIEVLARSDCSVLITGETGTGKELATQLIHESSRRASGPLITVNCAAIPESLFESELFGHERGAFTGAVGSRHGKLREANGGTLLLDEVGEMTPFVQAKLLRVLETRTVERLGSNRALPLDIRVIAATNQDLESQMEQKRFRPDLYYRLNVARVHMPPLAARREDIRALLEHEAARWNTGRSVRLRFSPEAAAVLERHTWPGNVRELKHLVESMQLQCARGVVQLSDLPLRMREQQGEAASLDERERLLAVLRETRWNKSEAAQRLNWSRMTLYRKLSRYSISS